MGELLEQTWISPDPPSEIAQNFSKLLEIGIAAAQRSSGDIWTDYNEHDPGVTILEALTYALTDISYRIDHPIDDLIASSLRETGSPLDQQPLFTGDRILTGDPHSESDFRKLAYDRIRGLRDLWIVPVGDETPGLHRVLVQLYPSVSGQPVAKRKDRVLADVMEIMNANRPLGEDFLYPELAPMQELAPRARITIPPEAAPETALADVLFRVGQKIDPAPQLREIGRDMKAGIAPEVIFDGPRLSLGWIPSDSLPPFGLPADPSSITESALKSDFVTDVSGLGLTTVRTVGDAESGLYISTLGRTPGDLDGVVLVRDGVELTFDAAEVLSHLNHQEESVRWDAGYASREIGQLDYAHVPLGRPDRNLHRYRTVQNLFPPAYRLGPETPQVKQDKAAKPDRAPTTSPDRDALRFQLKAYLAIFEQCLTDSLAQLSSVAQLFSFEPGLDQTYWTQPLTGPAVKGEDAPPDIAPVLGAASCEHWWQSYLTHIKTLTSTSDPVPERLNKVRSSLLARFGETMPDARMQRLLDRDFAHPEFFQARLAEQKRQRLATLDRTEGARAIGINPIWPAVTASKEAIRALSGHTGLLEIVDHVLLRPQPLSTPRGIKHSTINLDFKVFPTVPYRCFGLNWKGIALHLMVADAAAGYSGCPQFAAAMLDCLDKPDALQLSRSGTYHTQVMLVSDAGDPKFYILEQFNTREKARWAADLVKQLGTALRLGEVQSTDVFVEVALPINFLSRQLSVFLAPGCDEPDGPEFQMFVNEILRERCPAHLRHTPYWLDRKAGRATQACLNTFYDQLAACRANHHPTDDCLDRLNTASAEVRRIIETHYVSALCRTKQRWFDGIDP